MIVSTTEQGTDEWLSERAGKVTASCFGNILTGTGKKSTKRRGYLLTLAGEILAGKPETTFKSEWMQRGNDLEDSSRTTYEFITGNTVEQVGMVYLNEEKAVSCSPDGLIGDNGGYETKCPKMSTHVDYLLHGKCPTQYIPQVQGCLWVTGREWWDFMSFHPDLKPLIVRVERDEKYISLLEELVEEFVAELKATVKKLA